MPWSLCSHSWNTPACSQRLEPNDNHTMNETLSNYSTVASARVSSADEYYHIYMLGINHSKGLHNLGDIKIDLLLCLIAIFVLMYICIRNGVKSTGELRLNVRV